MSIQMTRRAQCALAAILVCGFSAVGVAQAGPVGDQDLLDSASNSGEWLMYGRDYLNHRFSPLSEITPGNVDQLRASWSFSTGGKLGGLEGTPLVRDGVIYISTDYSRVIALDARTGVMKWSFDPEFDAALDAELCCGPVNRGVALYGDLVYVNTVAADLVALNRDTGAIVWSQSLGNWRHGITATGAPLVLKGLVITGIAGAEYGVRGYIKAYDAMTGAEKWTTYMIPGPGEPGNETWPGDTWKTGGATTWQTGAYDPDLNLLYWGTGNPGPWNSDLRVGTINGRVRWWRSIQTMVRSSGAISTPPTTHGITTATTRRY